MAVYDPLPSEVYARPPRRRRGALQLTARVVGGVAFLLACAAIAVLYT